MRIGTSSHLCGLVFGMDRICCKSTCNCVVEFVKTREAVAVEEIGFIFQVSDLDTEVLMPQVSKALEKRLELNSRQTMPKMWKTTDKLNQTNKATEEELKRRRTRKKIWGLILMVLGVIVFVPGIVEPEGNTLLMVVGAIVIIVGFFNFRISGSITQNTDKFDKAAREFLAGHEESIKNQDVQICFSDEEMVTVTGELEELDQDAVVYNQVEFVIETKDVFLVIHENRGVVLQKKDITLGTIDEFREFVNERIKPIIDLTEE